MNGFYSGDCGCNDVCEKPCNDCKCAQKDNCGCDMIWLLILLSCCGCGGGKGGFGGNNDCMWIILLLCCCGGGKGFGGGCK